MLHKGARGWENEGEERGAELQVKTSNCKVNGYWIIYINVWALIDLCIPKITLMMRVFGRFQSTVP